MRRETVVKIGAPELIRAEGVLHMKGECIVPGPHARAFGVTEGSGGIGR